MVTKTVDFDIRIRETAVTPVPPSEPEPPTTHSDTATIDFNLRVVSEGTVIPVQPGVTESTREVFFNLRVTASSTVTPVVPISYTDIEDEPPTPESRGVYDQPVIHIGQLISEDITEDVEPPLGVRLDLEDTLGAWILNNRSVRIWMNHVNIFATEDNGQDIVNMSVNRPNGEWPIVSTRRIAEQWFYRIGSGDWKQDTNYNLDSFLVEGRRGADAPPRQFIKVTPLDQHNAPIAPPTELEDALPINAGKISVSSTDRPRRLRKVEDFGGALELARGLPGRTWYQGLPAPFNRRWFPGPPLRPQDDAQMTVTNGRDSAISLSPPHIPTLSAVVYDRYNAMTLGRKHRVRDADGNLELTPWPDGITNDPVHALVESDWVNRMMFTGVLQNPQYVKEDLNRYIQINAVGRSALMTQNNYFNYPTLETPRTIGGGTSIRQAVYAAARVYSDQYGITVGDMINFLKQGTHNTLLPYWWANNETLWSIFSKMSETEGPPSSFFEDERGQINFFGWSSEDRSQSRGPDYGRTRIRIGGPDLPYSGQFVITDHISDVVNDAIVTVNLKGFILPGNTQVDPTSGQLQTSESGVIIGYDAGTEINFDNMLNGFEVGWEELFNNHEENFWYQSTGQQRTLPGADSAVRAENTSSVEYRIDAGEPFFLRGIAGLNFSGNDPNLEISLRDHHLQYGYDIPYLGTIEGETDEGYYVTVSRMNASTIQIIILNERLLPRPVPTFSVYGTRLRSLASVSYWASSAVRSDQRTQDSIARNRYRVYGYGGYQSIYSDTAQELADRIVKYYRDGIRTVACTLQVPDNLRAQWHVGNLRPLALVRAVHPDYSEDFDLVVRSVTHRFVNHQHFVDLQLDENVYDRLLD